jgi:hypothetical protein
MHAEACESELEDVRFRAIVIVALMSRAGWIVLKNSQTTTWTLNLGNFNLIEAAPANVCCRRDLL